MTEPLPFPVPSAHDHLVHDDPPVTYRFMFTDGYVVDVTTAHEISARTVAVNKHGRMHGKILNPLPAPRVPTPEEPW